jgi:hypothetical protein
MRLIESEPKPNWLDLQEDENYPPKVLFCIPWEKDDVLNPLPRSGSRWYVCRFPQAEAQGLESWDD